MGLAYMSSYEQKLRHILTYEMYEMGSQDCLTAHNTRE